MTLTPSNDRSERDVISKRVSILARPARQGRRAWLFLVAGCLLAASMPAVAESCAVCGATLVDQVYVAVDRVTDEKKQICGTCERSLDRCFLCGVPANPNAAGYRSLPDRRVLCGRDAPTAVLEEAEGLKLSGEVKEKLDRQFSRFLNFPDTVKVEMVDRQRMVELFKYPGNDYTCPNIWGFVETRTNEHKVDYVVNVLSALPVAAFQATCAHEFAHTWINQNLTAARRNSISRDAVEAFCELISFRLMEAQNQPAQLAQIQRNGYTHGQIHLFLEAESRYGFNEVVDWMMSGRDDRLQAEDLGRLRNVEAPAARAKAVPDWSFASQPPGPLAAPDRLIVKGIFWGGKRPSALINDRSFEVGEERKVRVGTSNVLIRCLTIGTNSVRIQVVGPGERRELILKPRAD